MKPVLFTIENLPLIGSFPISSFGLSLLFAFMACSLVIWRIARLYDIDSETAVDVILVSLLGALLGARAYFVLSNFSTFDTFSKIALLSKYPGLSFWGAIAGGFLGLLFFARKKKFNFLQVTDLLTPALFLALSITSLGCLFGSCQYGLPSSLGITQVGVIGKRFPLQLFESAVYLWAFFHYYKSVLKFHAHGQIASKGIIFLGIVKFIFEFFRGDSQMLFGNISSGSIFAIILFITGVYVYYKYVANVYIKTTRFDQHPKRTLVTDIKHIYRLVAHKNKRQQLVLNLKKSWYNTVIDLRISLNRARKNILRLLNVKSNPTKF